MMNDSVKDFISDYLDNHMPKELKQQVTFELTILGHVTDATNLKVMAHIDEWGKKLHEPTETKTDLPSDT